MSLEKQLRSRAKEMISKHNDTSYYYSYYDDGYTKYDNYTKNTGDYTDTKYEVSQA